MNTKTTREEVGRVIQEYATGFPNSDFAIVAEAILAHEAAIRADEVRDAADEIDGLYFGPDQDMPFTTGARHKWGAMQAASRLRDRAARIEQEAQA